jgi:2-hydroxy-3-keto-5-methylthiopentenyl-1-phosphate phosphatase
MKIALQLDFDGTITEEDISFLLLDNYVGPVWREHLKDYTSGKIPVGAFNRRVFGLVKADLGAMTELISTSPRVRVRPGFRELLDYATGHDYKVAIVSNGLTFYIEHVLKMLGVNGMDIYAAENTFFPGGMSVRYVGPDGSEKEAGFKEAWTEALVKQGYDVIYAGNGRSDIYPSKLARHVFATGDLVEQCIKEKVPYTLFNDFFEVIEALEKLGDS